MIGFNETVTIYNKRYDPTAKKNLWQKTVIRDVSWAGSQKVTLGDGLSSNDGYSVRIPLKAMELADGTFLPRDQYQALPDVLYASGYWTAQNGDVVVLGEGPDVDDAISEVTKQFTDSFIVTNVNTANLSRLLPHLRLEGR